MEWFKRLSVNGGIRSRVIGLMGSQVLIAVVCILLVTVYMINRQIGQQTKQLFQVQASALNSAIEQRLDFLIANTELLATNELMVSALMSGKESESYLPQLVTNFIQGKDVVYLNVVDFDGQPLFETRSNNLKYNESKHLRQALALGKSAVLIDDANHLVVISPIEYFATSQGALVVAFDFKSVVDATVRQFSDLAIRINKHDHTIYSFNYGEDREYYSYLFKSEKSLPAFQRLGVTLEVAVPQMEYARPANEAMKIVLVVGAFFILLSIFTSHWTAVFISKPILELHRRVQEALEGRTVRCSPIGGGREMEGLAKAFDERTHVLEFQAGHDPLTNLPNRMLFVDRLEHTRELARRTGRPFAVLFLDLDRFKEVNDSYGHNVGDLLIKEVAMRITACTRTSDTVARMGGDEFTVLVEQIEQEEDVLTVIQHIMSQFESPLALEQHQFYVTCSMGVAVYPGDGNSAEALLKNADAAMYKAKSEGRNAYCFYKQELTETLLERVKLESELRSAIKNEELRVFYQPQYDLFNRRVIGMEALIRWQHPEHGLVFPDRFIPLAEDTGMIVDVDREMMRIAMKTAATWRAAGLRVGVLSLNLSMIQLGQADFVDFVKGLMERTKLPPECVMFEVTETQAMTGPEQTEFMLNKLRSLGVGLAIDDFGTGFSSLSYLKRLPVNKIKIDRSFISDIPSDQDDVALTRAIIAISESLNLEVIAEGVETEEQAAMLLESGCREGQGYLFSKPVSEEIMRSLLVCDNAIDEKGE